MVPIHWEEDVYLGDAIMLEDGSFYFQVRPNPGVWSYQLMLYVADKLRELNEPGEKIIDEYFERKESE